ncbi:kinase-like domain-containing protein [Rhizophagus clarus]|uniref:Kinase-like domain-containing protein n=1 Tax=Rhizophagus clarus TaxID=94130 RepID=A0A8H3LPR3_9GLOM|nr:kinase-like domain-containing protein [Rhizophagus clarus]
MELLTKYHVDLSYGKEIIEKNFANWTSGNEIIDNFIRKKQLNYTENGLLFEWIPYSEFINIKEIGNNCLTTAIWKNGPIYYHNKSGVSEWIRGSFEKVTLKFLYDIQNITDESINKVESYMRCGKFIRARGISQSPDTKVYILVFNDSYLDDYCEKCGNLYRDKCCRIDQLKNNFTNRTSENAKLIDFIQKLQLKINSDDQIFEWISHNEFIYIKPIGDNCLTTAIWKDGPLHYDKCEKKYIRNFAYKKVGLRFLYDSRNINDEFLNKVESYSHFNGHWAYGISQNPDTKVYILVFSDRFLDYYCEKCDLIFEWIPYNKFTEIKRMNVEDEFAIAIWKDGPLIYTNKRLITKESYEKVFLNYLYNIQDITEFLNKVESYLVSGKIYGISQNPDTNVYILNGIEWCKQCQISQLKSNFTNWTSENVKLDEFVQKMQLKISSYDMIFEWIPYNEFTEIKGMNVEDELDEFATAIWKNITDEFLNKVELYIDGIRNIYGLSQDPDTKVYILVFSNECFSKYCLKCLKRYENYYSYFFLKYLYNSQNIINEITYSMENSYGISQNLKKKDFIILVFPLKYYCENCGEKYNNQFEIDSRVCIFCQTKHEDKKIRDLIQETRLNIDYNSNSVILEWIPYNQFNNIKEIGKGGFSTVYSAIWKDGLLYYEYHKHGGEWKRKSNTRVALKCLHNSQNFLDEFINEVKAYPNRKLENILKIYGISQNSDTKDYIMVLEYAEATGKQPFIDQAHNEILAISICNGTRPKINEKIMPKCYIDLIKKCWNSNPDNRPNSIEIKDTIKLFYDSLDQNFEKKEQKHYEIEEQFKKTQEYRKANFLSIKNNQVTVSHPQAVYSSRLLNPFTKNLDYNINNYDTVEIIDFTK